MLKSKDRAALRAMANGLPAILNLGKEGITPEFTKSVAEALAARELVKLNILQSCEIDPRDAASTLSGRTGSHVVQVIGRKFVLYKKKPKKGA